MMAARALQRRAQQRCKVAVAILLCLLTISVVPLANKAVLKRGANGVQPLAMTRASAIRRRRCSWPLPRPACRGDAPLRDRRAPSCGGKQKTSARSARAFGRAASDERRPQFGVRRAPRALMATDIFWTALFARANQPRGAQSGGRGALAGCFVGAAGLHQRARRRRAGRRAALRHRPEFDRPGVPGYCGGALRKSATREIAPRTRRAPSSRSSSSASVPSPRSRWR